MANQRQNLWKVQLTLLPTAKQQAVKRVCKISKITQREWFGTIAFAAIRVETDCWDSRRLIVNYFFSLSQTMRFMFVYCRGTVNNARFLWTTNAGPSWCSLSFHLACGLLEFLVGKSVKYRLQIVNESEVSAAIQERFKKTVKSNSFFQKCAVIFLRVATKRFWYSRS